MDLGSPFQRGRGGPGGWWILDEPELHLGEHVLVPDLAGWRRVRMPEIPDVDRTDKIAIYAAAEVTGVWLLSPALRTLEVLHRHEKSWLVHVSYRGEQAVRAEPFGAVELVLGDLWLPEQSEDAP